MGSRRSVATRLAAALGALGAVPILAVIWLAFRPMPIDFLLPALESALSESSAGRNFTAQSARLTWGGLEAGLEIQIEGVQILGAEGAQLANFPQVLLHLSGRELLRGSIAPRALVFEAPALHMLRDDEGELDAGAGGTTEEAGSADVLPARIRDLMADEEPGQPYSFLRRLAIQRGQLVLEDRKRRLAWRAEPLEVEVRRDPPGFRADASLPLSASRDAEQRAGGGSEVLITAEARASPVGDDLDVKLTAELADFDASTLDTWWPKRAAVDAREWVVENIPRGTARLAHLDLGLRFPESDLADAQLESLVARVDAEDVEVHYLRPLPPVTGIGAELHFGPDRFDFDIAGGTLDDLSIGGGKVVLTDIRAVTPTLIDIDARLSGPVSTVLSIIDREPLDLLEHTPLSPERTRGTIEGRIGFAFPLSNVTLEDVRMKGEAKLHDVEIDDLPLAFRKGELTLAFTDRSLEIGGPFELAGVPASLQWSESFGRDEPGQLAIHVEIQTPRSTLLYDEQEGATTVRFETSNPGALIEIFGWSDRLVGGEGDVVAKRPAPTAPLEGHFSIRDYRIAEATWLTRLVQALSVKGWVASATGQGVEMKRTEGDFRYGDDVLEILTLQMESSDAVLHATGKIGLSDQQVDFRGTFVPMQTFNRFVDYLPVLGRLFTGSEDEGLFVADFHVYGPADDPEVDVDQLTTLTPGIVRSLVRKISPSDEAPPADS